MQLWTDYEGLTIDGAFPLRKLLMPEGRSAFFSTAGLSGEPTVVRLIECHFDEEEILSRWRCLEALSHPNFLKFERFGQTELDGRPVVYAVFEKVDGNLAEILDQGSLAVNDVSQLGSSMVAALDVLHTHGFVHEHIEPRNIFSKNGVVKLRGDCIREAPEGEEGRAAKQRDVRDLATVLLQGLTQRKTLEGVSESAVPPPFGQMIRKGMDGSWGLENIRAALGRQFGANLPAAPTVVNGAAATPIAAELKRPIAADKASVQTEAGLPLGRVVRSRNAGFAGATAQKSVWRDKNPSSDKNSGGDRNFDSDEHGFSLRSRWVATGAVALLLLLCLWLVAHEWRAHSNKAEQAAAISQPAASSQRQTLTRPSPQRAATSSPRVNAPAPTGSHGGWRVITFTYNRRADAQKKVSDLARSHPELQPEVFTPSGHAPFLVSIGGVMDRDTARALARRSRSLGLPHDMYAQNYSR